MNKLLLIGLLFVACACDTDQKLDKSVFIHDPLNYDLPAYSEFGYNTFGVFYDRTPFISDDYLVPVKVAVKDSRTRFILTGKLKTSGRNDPMELTFEIPDLDPLSVYDLNALHARSLDLVEANIKVAITIGGEALDNVELLEGNLEFARYQRLYVDQQPVQIILSGTFAFRVTIDGVPSAFKNGRFDLGISPANFFRM